MVSFALETFKLRTGLDFLSVGENKALDFLAKLFLSFVLEKYGAKKSCSPEDSRVSFVAQRNKFKSVHALISLPG